MRLWTLILVIVCTVLLVGCNVSAPTPTFSGEFDYELSEDIYGGEQFQESDLYASGDVVILEGDEFSPPASNPAGTGLALVIALVIVSSIAVINYRHMWQARNDGSSSSSLSVPKLTFNISDLTNWRNTWSWPRWWRYGPRETAGLFGFLVLAIALAVVSGNVAFLNVFALVMAADRLAWSYYERRAKQNGYSLREVVGMVPSSETVAEEFAPLEESPTRDNLVQLSEDVLGSPFSATIHAAESVKMGLEFELVLPSEQGGYSSLGESDEMQSIRTKMPFSTDFTAVLWSEDPGGFGREFGPLLRIVSLPKFLDEYRRDGALSDRLAKAGAMLVVEGGAVRALYEINLP